MTLSTAHIPVMLEKVLAHCKLREGSLALDCTAGMGGHSQELVKKVGKSGRVVLIDKDPFAISRLKSKFSNETVAGSVSIQKESFGSLDKATSISNLKGKFDFILADLGVSSPQLDNLERGFSFSNEAPLDMRMDTEIRLDAKSWLEQVSFSELRQVLRDYGEEPKAHFIAQSIVEARQVKAIETTTELAEIVSAAVHYKTKSRTHPATRTFMAIRMAVNREIEELNSFVQIAVHFLSDKGRLAIISFHSLEDRIVKKAFQS